MYCIAIVYIYDESACTMNSLWQNTYNQVIFTNDIREGCFGEARREIVPGRYCPFKRWLRIPRGFGAINFTTLLVAEPPSCWLLGFYIKSYPAILISCNITWNCIVVIIMAVYSPISPSSSPYGFCCVKYSHVFYCFGCIVVWASSLYVTLGPWLLRFLM